MELNFYSSFIEMIHTVKFTLLKVYNSVVFQYIHKGVQPSLLPSFRRNPLPLSSHTPSPLPSAPGTANLLSVSGFHISGIT